MRQKFSRTDTEGSDVLKFLVSRCTLQWEEGLGMCTMSVIRSIRMAYMDTGPYCGIVQASRYGTVLSTAITHSSHMG